MISNAHNVDIVLGCVEYWGSNSVFGCYFVLYVIVGQFLQGLDQILNALGDICVCFVNVYGDALHIWILEH
ncbi:hypothetical protein FB192DRAFT_1406516 [Mucor lusitanicus]|uniref:Uncharacterized protein n=1 Tax=Mucor circinelloides f. lusitanicus TaxID=29924 RepID=A0A8H4EWS1_MUCCL|nr:hypothetical protein FB192DRAFT_1406516 [Mucor lusitanicus]